MASIPKCLRDIRLSPVQILRDNFGRTPLRCDEGEVRNDLGAAQERHACECQLVRLIPLSQLFRRETDHSLQ